ncbi:MAG: ABC transporter permease [Candidatus Firestonebacteria bacterium]
MIIFSVISMGVEEIKVHKLRTTLTMLGVILGVASLIALFSIVEGSKKRSLEWLKEVGGFEKMNIRDQELKNADMLRINRSKGRTYEDSMAILKKCDTVRYASPEVAGRFAMSYKGKNYRVSGYGITDVMFKINNYEVAYGRSITDWDIARRARVCILGTTAARELFKNEFPLGKNVYINNQYFTVVGILKEYKMMSGKRNALEFKNNWVATPITTDQDRITGNEKITYLNLQVKDVNRIGETIQQVKNVLLKRHFYLEDFAFDSREEGVERMKQQNLMYTVLLGCIGGISLLVGGIGIMNIMLASVTARTREIGIRRALGATKANVLFQFLVEAVIISVAGGLLGILLGLFLVKVFSYFPEMEPSIALGNILLAFSFSVGIGLFFGVYPARKAANINPIEALRYE